MEELHRARPDARIINLETSITRSENYVPKGINYRMSPENAACLPAAGIDCCVLGNNHVLDWGRAGLLDTLRRLDELGIKTAGAGVDLAAAGAPAVLNLGRDTRVLVLSLASVTSGVPARWAASRVKPGVNVLSDLSQAAIERISTQLATVRRRGDILAVSIHWGPNWGYDVPDDQRRFAHALIDHAQASIVHGHSSHHPKAIELYRRRLILYGCGDFLNDYEGISGHEAYRGDLTLMYFADVDAASGELAALQLVPLQMRRFRLSRPSLDDCHWLQRRVEREVNRFGAHIDAASPERWILRAGTR